MNGKLYVCKSGKAEAETVDLVTFDQLLAISTAMGKHEGMTAADLADHPVYVDVYDVSGMPEGKGADDTYCDLASTATPIERMDLTEYIV